MLYLRICVGALCICNLALVFGFRDMRSLDHQLSASCSFASLFLIFLSDGVLLLLQHSIIMLSSEQSTKTSRKPLSSKYIINTEESVSERIMRKHLQMLNWGILLAKARASYQFKKNALLESKMEKIRRRRNSRSSSSCSTPDKNPRNSRGKSPPLRAYEMRKWKSWGGEMIVSIPDFHSPDCRNNRQ